MSVDAVTSSPTQDQRASSFCLYSGAVVVVDVDALAMMMMMMM